MDAITQQYDQSNAGALRPIALNVRDIGQVYRGEKGSMVTLHHVTFDVFAGEFLSIIGPSGAGKSTLLNIIAGLDSPSDGTIALNGSVISAQDRLGKIGLMPQRDLLLPWRTALENAIAGLEVRKIPKHQAREQAMTLFERVGLANFAGTYPYALSGGMRQRVARGRSALASGPILLSDEPLGALDALTRSEMYQWLLEIWQTLGKTIILVTHDITEALVLADRVLVMSALPGTITHEVLVQLPRPRNRQIQVGGPFVQLREHLMEYLEMQQ